MNRRYFLMGTAAAGALRAESQSPNNTVRVACVGVGGQGKSHIGSVRQNAERRDRGVVRRRREPPQRAAGGGRETRQRSARRPSRTSGSCWRTSPSTPSRSPRPTITTRCRPSGRCQAGKDVYVEKPCSHNMFEARQIVAAAKKYNRIVQHGTNSRSAPAVREAVKQMRERPDRRRLHGARPVLQVARHHRPHAGGARAGRACTTTCGWARRPSARSRATASTTTGTGSGTTATATSATRASTRWTSPAGAWA